MVDYIYWILDQPLFLVERFTGFEFAPGYQLFIARIVIGFILAYILFRLANWLWKILEQMLGRKGGGLVDQAEYRALGKDGATFTKSLEAAQDLTTTIAPLKRSRNWGQLAEVYASLNKHKDAAKYYKKAGNRIKSAEELAKAGYTAKAAKLLVGEGDFETAARLYTEIGKHVEAAKALDRAGKKALAADAWFGAGKYADAVDSYVDYFSNPPDALDAQLVAAEACYKLLRTDAAKSFVTDEKRKTLLLAIATRFEQTKRYDIAAASYREAGDVGRAGEVYLLAGKLEDAANCMKQAGRPKDASRIVGRFHQQKGNFKEAATAYVQSGDFLLAAECFAKAADPVRAAECFEKAGEFYRAGLAYAHAARFEPAIPLLQRLKENDPNFDVSRGLLGRCFYELHDYAHCAAALDNHLTGKRVDSGTVEFFYMLALAYEQIGKLDESRELLYKIRTVNVGFRDVSQRISSISSRISLKGSATQITPAPGTHAGGTGGDSAQLATQMMESVEQSLGGRYVLEQELGRGGMGVVFRARDSQLDRLVALKFLGCMVDSSEEFRQRFIREARTAAKISHPNIVNIYDISATAGKAYIAMEFIDGPSLHKYINQRKALKPKEAVNVIVQACSALAAIHEAGIVHRDIKPDNILLAKGGLVKLTDFGLAKADDSRMTRTGVVMGTPSYMAPEQVLGKDADVRSDVYSLGLVLHECLTGETAFLGPDVLERQLKDLPPPPSAKSEGVSAELDAIVMRCVAKKPEERYPNIRELMGALRALEL